MRGNLKQKSSENIEKEVIRAQEEKKSFLSQIKTQVRGNNSLLRSIEKSKDIPKKKPKSEEDVAVMKVNKQKSMGNLSKNLQRRIQMDKSTKATLKDLDQEQKLKKFQIEKRIEEVKRRNQLRVKELDQLQKRYLKKINQEYNRDKLKEEKLVEQYEKTLQKEGKINYAKEYRQAVELEDWKHILQEKRKLGKMVEAFKKKQQTIIREQYEKTQKIKLSESQKDEKTPLQLEVPLVKGNDAKQIGNQYLQYAKKMQTQVKDKPKLKLMDINMKSIDYSKEIMNKIARNTGDLSRLAPPPQSPLNTVRQTKTKDLGEERKEKDSNKDKIEIFKIEEDEEIKKQLEEIKSNIKQLQEKS